MSARDKKFTDSPKHRGGRPRSDNPRRNTVSACLTDAEHADVLAKVSASGLTRNEAIRLLLLHEVLPVKVYGGVGLDAAKIFTYLAPLQSNLNQIARHLNKSRTSQLAPSDAATINKNVLATHQFLKKIRQAILLSGQQK